MVKDVSFGGDDGKRGDKRGGGVSNFLLPLTHAPKSFEDIVSGNYVEPLLKELRLYHGESALFLSEKENTILSKPFKHDLKGNCLEGFRMTVLKWTPNFLVDVESSIVPLWVSFEHLPCYYYDKRTLLSIVRMIGKPLKLDVATISRSKPNVTWFYIEVKKGPFDSGKVEEADQTSPQHYAKCTWKERKALWADLRHLSSVTQDPPFLRGDLHVIFDVAEYVRTTQLDTRAVDGFNAVIHD
ncbi:hypothetical protein ACH5RR_037258 [Cinchona calisaya]|uniref:DUF4283 domain-containing protein n=1 Tax=Cinchona calisaya TaxID=153742 RepID=A0ABD2Y9A4_9GENT